MENSGSASVFSGACWWQCGKYFGYEGISPQDQALVFCMGNAGDPRITARAICCLERVDVIEL